MGYSIPGADFTTPAQLKTNVGAKTGQSLGSAFAQFGKALYASNVQAQKTEALEGQLSDNILIENGKAVNSTLEAGKAQYGAGTTLYEEWSAEIIRKGNEATQAEIDFKFGDLDAAGKKEKLGIVTSFDTYLETSKQDMGRFIADVDKLGTKGFTVIGDSTNGEKYLNQIVLTANGGGRGDFGEGAIVNRSLSGEDKKSINTTVKIPVDSDFFSTLNSKSGGVSSSIFETGIEEKVPGLTKVNVDGKEYYQFQKTINTNTYSTPGGSDFVLPIIPRMVAGDVFKELGILNKEGAIDPKYYAQASLTPEFKEDGATVPGQEGERPLVQTLEDQEATYTDKELGLNTSGLNIKSEVAAYTSTSTENSAEGFEQTTTSSVIDINRMNNNKALDVVVNTEVAGMLLKGRSSEAKILDFNKYGVVSLDAFPPLKEKYGSLRDFLEKGDVNQVKTFTTQMVKHTMFSDMFNVTDKNGKRVYSQMEATPDFVKYLNKNNILNSAGEPYKENQTVFVKNVVKESKIIKPPELSYNTKIYNNLQKGMDESVLFAALTQTPAKTNIMHTTKDGVKGTYVMVKGFPMGTALKEKALENLFKP